MVRSHIQLRDHKFLFFLALMMTTIIAVACIDYDLREQIEQTPEILVTPTEHDFGALYAGTDTDTIKVVVENIGNDLLKVEDIYLASGNENFTLESFELTDLNPKEKITLTIVYDPLTYESNEDKLIILSNDSDEEEVIVPLEGVGDAPLILVQPNHHDFDDVYLGCDEGLELTITNLGNVDLEIYDVDYFTTVPVDFYPEDFEMYFGPYPWVIPPWGTIRIDLTYEPLDIIYDQGYFSIASNDPLKPTVVATQEGRGDYQGYITESYIQDGTKSVDILFVVDNSCSMAGNQSQLSNNFATFINTFTTSNIDYQIAFITTDSPNFVGDIITPLVPDPVAEAMAQIDSIGHHGNANERGIDMSHTATSGNGDAAPGSAFLRKDAKFVIIYISDEDDYSSTDPTAMEKHIKSLKPTSNMVSVHAVAGDVPHGCTGNGGAADGARFYDLVTRMNGTFLSICATDWGTPMEQLAHESMSLSYFYLSGDAIEDTITVKVDGSISKEWYYDYIDNVVIFTKIPVENSSIEISYATWADCDAEISIVTPF